MFAFSRNYESLHIRWHGDERRSFGSGANVSSDGKSAKMDRFLKINKRPSTSVM